MKKVEKKQYVRPQLVKHGKVETLTLGQWYNNCSDPV
jgi:hypothetical protein